jgi:hypothetical protein
MRLRDLISPSDHARVGHVRESYVKLESWYYIPVTCFTDNFGRLYAKDLHCPTDWIRALKAVLPSCLMQLGSFDLFRVLPKDMVPEVLMAYVGTQMSMYVYSRQKSSILTHWYLNRRSGFHRCFSGTVALNLMIESEGT